MHTISINQFLSKINFKQVAHIEPLSSNSAAEENGAASAIRFIDSSRLLTAQPLDYFRALARGRMLDVPHADFKTGIEMKRLVPLDAIHHLKRVPEKSGEALIVYRAYDPVCPSKHFRLPVPASLIEDLLDRDEGGLIDIGGGKFVFSGEVENARPMEAKNIARLAQCGEDGPDTPPVSIIELSDGAIIPSAFLAQTVEGMVRRPLPSACLPSFCYEAGLSV